MELQGRVEQSQNQIGLLNAMTKSCASSDFCPNLRTIIYGSHYDPFPLDEFFAMAHSRFQRDCDCPLTSLRLFSYVVVAPSPDVAARLHILRNEGHDAGFLSSDDAQILILKEYEL